MKPEISLITIWTNNIDKMRDFYNKVLGFKINYDLGNYVEFENHGVRFAICMRKVMYDYSKEYEKTAFGQSFELAFPCESPKAVYISFKDLIENGATSISDPHNMPWNQRTALFSDPDGNIHEIFAEIV